jgi:hypothetical protein
MLGGDAVGFGQQLALVGAEDNLAIVTPGDPGNIRCGQHGQLPIDLGDLRTRFESIAERKLRRRQLTEDGNVEIDGQGLREGLRLAAGREQMSCHGTVAAAVVTTRRR